MRLRFPLLAAALVLGACGGNSDDAVTTDGLLDNAGPPNDAAAVDMDAPLPAPPTLPDSLEADLGAAGADLDPGEVAE